MTSKNIPKSVLVTRPQPAAMETADKLKALGFSPIILPLSKIVALEVKHLPAADALIITSANALRFLAKAELEKISHKPLYCVGAETANAARQKGFCGLIFDRPTAQELAIELVGQNRHYLYLAGRVRRPELEKALKNERLDVVETYITEPCDIDKSDQARLPNKVDAVLLYSAFGHDKLLFLNHFFSKETQFICLSQRIADALPNHILGQKYVAQRPDEKALFEMLTFVS